jgi:hypothetical protein
MFSVVDSAHGTSELVVVVRTARISPRGDVSPLLENAKVTEVTASEARVKLVAVPIVVPAEFRNATVPVQDAAVPLDVAEARLMRFTPMVSVLAKPTSGNEKSEVLVVVVVCASADPVMAAASANSRRKFRIDIVITFQIFGISRKKLGCNGRYLLERSSAGMVSVKFIKDLAGFRSLEF